MHVFFTASTHRVTLTLQDRNRKLNAELTKLKNTTAEQQGDIQDLQQQLHKAHSKLQEHKSLIKELEIDLMHRSALACTTDWLEAVWMLTGSRGKCGSRALAALGVTAASLLTRLCASIAM